VWVFKPYKMARIPIGSGTTLDFTLTLDKNASEYDNIFVDISAGAFDVKCSLIEKVGFNKIEIGVIPTKIVVSVTTAQSANLVGDLFMEVKLIDSDVNVGDSVPKDTLITMVNNKLKKVI